MDSHTHSAQFRRLEVVETGRRRRWSEEEKLRIVMESLAGPRQASSTARRYGISPSLLFAWRRSFRVARIDFPCLGAGFVPAVVVPEEPPFKAPSAQAGRMEIVVRSGRRITVDSSVDAAALARVMEVVERR